MNRRIKSCGRVAAFFAKLILAYICAVVIKIARPDLRNVWLIAERGDDARDNGYFFYRYLRTKHPEVNVWYVINSSSADFQKLKEYPQKVEHNSFRHFVLYALCKVRISSNAWGGDLPYTGYFYKLRKWMNKRKRSVFLQHGITKDCIKHLFAENTKIDLFVCGALPEFEYVKGAFHYPDGVVAYTGFARFDNLRHIQAKQQILFMPTFRKWLQGKSEEEICASEFVSHWNDMLNNPKLADLLEKEDVELVFYPHYVLQPHIHLFHTNSQNIKIAKFAEYDVQQLLKESALLVTDFSSVFFDFAYMGKPVIYYQFDRERYIREHYDFTKGYFSYDDMGFGPVCFDAENLIKQIEASIQSGFVQEQAYADRTEQFFPMRDTQNCDRIYDAIQKMLNS